MASINDKQVKPDTSDHRRKGNSFVYIGTVVILIITVVTFVFVPAIGGAAGDSGPTLGSWNGMPIAFVQNGYFVGQVQQIKAQYESQGYKDTGDQFFAYQVWRKAFDNMAVHLAVLDYSQAAGISVSESYIDKKMIESQAFLEKGVFSKRKYRDATSSFKLTLRKDIRDSTLKSRYITDVVSYVPSKAETAFLSAMAQSERVIEYVAFPFSGFPDSERLAFAKANAAFFKKVRLSRITLSSSSKEAGQVLAKVKAGSVSFEEAAKSYSKDSYAAKGGDMGSRSVWELNGELKDTASLDAVLALAKGELSPVYETVSGSWAFYRVEETAVDPDFASAELVKSVTDYLNRNEKGRLEDWAVATAAAFSTRAATDFAAASLVGGLVVKETKPFPLNYGKALDVGYFSLLGALDTTDLAELNGADSNDKFLTTVFSLKAGEVSAPVVINDYALVIRVKEIKSADQAGLGLLEAYYPTVVQQGVSGELQAKVLASPSLKDNFMTTFSKVYAPTK